MAGPGVPANSPLLNPNAPLSGKPLYQAAVNLANAQYMPAINDLQSQATQNNAQAQNAQAQTNSYFSNLGQYVNQSNQQLGQIGTDLNSQLQSQAAQNAQNLQQVGANATSSLLAYAPQAYGNNSLAQPALQALQTEIARQQGLSAQTDSAFQHYGAAQGANFSSLGASNLGSYAMHGQQDLANIAQAGQLKNQPLMQKIADLQQQRGALIGTDLGKLRQQEIANQISEQGLGIRQATLNNTIQNDRATQAHNTAAVNATIRGQNIAAQTSTANNERTTAASNLNNQRTTATSRANNAANNAIKQEQLNASQVGTPAWYRAQQAQAKASGTGAAKPLSPNENNSWFNNLGRVEQLIRDGQTHGGTEAQIRASLGDGSNPSKKSYDPVMIQAAYELLGYGSVDQSTAANMHNMGLRGGTYNGRPIKVTASYSPSNPQQSPLSSGFGNVLGGIVNGVR